MSAKAGLFSLIVALAALVWLLPCPAPAQDQSAPVPAETTYQVLIQTANSTQFKLNYIGEPETGLYVYRGKMCLGSLCQYSGTAASYYVDKKLLTLTGINGLYYLPVIYTFDNVAGAVDEVLEGCYFYRDSVSLAHKTTATITQNSLR